MTRACFGSAVWFAESLKRDGEEEAKNECVDSHLRVYECREQEPDGGGASSSAKKRGDGQHCERGREGAGRQVVVGDGEGGSRYRDGQQGCQQNDRGPSSAGALETEAGELPGRDEDQEDAADVPEEDREVRRQMQPSGRVADDWGEEREACVGEEELRAEGIKLRIGDLLDRGEKDFGVVYSEVVALDKDGGAGEEKEREERVLNP